MRFPASQPAQRELRRRLERADGLPLRPAAVRFALDREQNTLPSLPPLPHSSWRTETDLDPGWLVATQRDGGDATPLAVIAGRSWWPNCSRSASDALGRLWRHGVAVALAALRAARESEHPFPEKVAQAGLLHSLGLWVVASVEPEWLPRWLSTAPGPERRAFERSTLGTEVVTLGRTVAERWGLEPAVADAAWLHADAGHPLPRGISDARTLALVQGAFAIAEQTPWALHMATAKDPVTHDPRVKILMAEVQARCRGSFLDPDATPREERMTREIARLRLEVSQLRRTQAAQERLVTALVEADPTESPEAWAERAGLAWCGEPGVSVAQVEWGEESKEEVPLAQAGHVASHVLPLRAGRRTVATLRLWADCTSRLDELEAAIHATLPAWQAWAVMVDERARLAERLDGVSGLLHDLHDGEEPRLRKAKLDALAEFAAGAGHELNNPLAVIAGRAQLLMARASDPATLRSLRAIQGQAQRAHRILRDLMYVGRPPEPRPRVCTPDEIWRSSLRDARPDAEDRGILLMAEGFEQSRKVWADPDGMRHLADTLLRNAIEATPRGGTVRVSSLGNSVSLRWSVHDNGRGINASEGPHLFDPFFCGRQAGRGLGMGLPRAARFLELAGGDIRWQSVPGQGATFLVRMPVVEPPRPPTSEVHGRAEVTDPRLRNP